ncbi:MAG: 5'-nucleotidase C-terminal domain-containing protein [Clostridia bacterium]|nr:5'-nucleotidase C-terminal domain-containing protein [Clostridia bacterium]
MTAELEEGKITESDLATSMLYGLNNHLVTVRCKGANLISILSTNNLADAVRADQSGVFGGMVIPSGFTYTITYEPVEGNAYGGKVEISDVCLSNGEPVDPEAWYTVTTTDYELGGGGSQNMGCFYSNTCAHPGQKPRGISNKQEISP